MRLLLSTGLLLSFAAVNAHGAVIIGNFPAFDVSFTFINAAAGGSTVPTSSLAIGSGGPESSKAAGFTIGATPISLTSIDLRLHIGHAASVPLVQLYDDVAGVPTNLLTTLTNPAFNLGIDAAYSFTPSSIFMMASGSTYWLTVSNSAAGVADSFLWTTDIGVPPIGPFASNAGYMFASSPPPPAGSSSVFNSYEVKGVAVPEPATLLLVILGLVAVSAARNSK